MQPDLPPAATRPMFPIHRGTARSVSTRALVGLLLALVGLVLESAPSLLSFYLIRSGMSFLDESQIVGSLGTAGFLLIGVGLFLLLRELASSLSLPPAYLRFTPLVVLVAALFQVGVGVIYLWLLPAMFGGASMPPISEDVFVVLQVGSWIADFAAGASVLMSFFGTVKALAAAPGAPAFPPPP